MLCSGLQNLSVACTWVKTVDEARRALERRTFDAIVTDIMLGPDTPSGLDLVKEVQPTGAPVLVITAFADLGRVKEAMNHGAAYLMEKPFRAEELSRALELGLGRAQGPRSLRRTRPRARRANRQRA